MISEEKKFEIKDIKKLNDEIETETIEASSRPFLAGAFLLIAVQCFKTQPIDTVNFITGLGSAGISLFHFALMIHAINNKTNLKIKLDDILNELEKDGLNINEQKDNGGLKK